jgi:hypothetical protein
MQAGLLRLSQPGLVLDPEFQLCIPSPGGVALCVHCPWQYGSHALELQAGTERSVCWCIQIAYPFMWTLPTVYWLLQYFRPGMGAAVLLPTSMLRFVTFKLQWDLVQIPAMHELTRVGFKALFSGDISQWDKAIQMPHYTAQSMPAISLHTAIHLIQVNPA